MAPVIEPVDPDDRATMDGWYALRVRCQQHDTPTLPPVGRRRHAVRLRPSAGFLNRAWVVRDGAGAGAAVVAAAEVALPLRDDTDTGFALVLVDPRHRRRGLGTRLLDHLAADARATGRRRLVLRSTGCPHGAGAGAGFLAAAGARVGLTELRRRLTLPADPLVLRGLAVSATRAARGYRLVRWTGPAPRRFVRDYAALVGRRSTDSPTGGLTPDPQRRDTRRVREREAEAEAAGECRLVAAAATGGRLVAYTEITVPAAGEDPGQHGVVARQGDTLVVPEHRGRRLGLWTKLANLEQLAAAHPQVRALDTANADGNRGMVAIDEVLGFVPILQVTDWELDLARVAPGGEPDPGPDPTGGQAGTTAAISAAASGP